MATQFANGKIVTDGLVLCLDAADLNSYPTTGTTWFDLAGSNNGTLTNGPTFSGTGASSSIVFDGVDDYVGLGSLSTLVGKTNVTVDCWFFNDSLPSGFQSIVGQYGSSGWLIHTSTQTNLSILVLVGGGVSYGGINITPTNTWYNVMLSYDGTLTGNQNRLKMYVNGVLRTFDYYVGGEVPSTWPDAATNANIGTLPGFGRYFNGKIPIVRIYEKTLSSSEVLQNYNAQKARFGIS